MIWDPFFQYLLAICISSFMKHLFKCFVNFQNFWLLIFKIIDLWFLPSLDISSLLHVDVVNTFSILCLAYSLS